MRVLPYHIPLVADRGEGSHCGISMETIHRFIRRRPAPVRASAQAGDRLGHQADFRAWQPVGLPTEITIRVAEKIKQLFPSMNYCGSPTRGPKRWHLPSVWPALTRAPEVDHVRKAITTAGAKRSSIATMLRCRSSRPKVSGRHPRPPAA